MFCGFAYRCLFQNEVVLLVLPKLNGKNKRHHLGGFRDYLPYLGMLLWPYLVTWIEAIFEWDSEEEKVLQLVQSAVPLGPHYPFNVHSVCGRLRYYMEPVASSDRRITIEALWPWPLASRYSLFENQLLACCWALDAEWPWNPSCSSWAGYYAVLPDMKLDMDPSSSRNNIYKIRLEKILKTQVAHRTQTPPSDALLLLPPLWPNGMCPVTNWLQWKRVKISL